MTKLTAKFALHTTFLAVAAVILGTVPAGAQPKDDAKNGDKKLQALEHAHQKAFDDFLASFSAE